MEKIYRFIGLACKAGKLISGNELCEKNLRKSGLIKLVILTEDAADNTKKRFFDKCSFRGVRVLVFGEKKILGGFIGKDERSVIAILDNGFANKLYDMLTIENNNGGDAYGENKGL